MSSAQVTHPFFWRIILDMLNRTAEMLVQKYFKTVTMDRVKKIREEHEEELKRQRPVKVYVCSNSKLERIFFN